MTEKIKEERINNNLQTESAIKIILQTFPMKIRTLSESLLNAKRTKEELISKNKSLEFEMKSKIFEETLEIDEEIKVNMVGWKKEAKENYKPQYQKVRKQRFKNELQREKALSKRLRENSEYISNSTVIHEMSKSIEESEIRLSYIKRLNNNATYLVLLGDK